MSLDRSSDSEFHNPDRNWQAEFAGLTDDLYLPLPTRVELAQADHELFVADVVDCIMHAPEVLGKDLRIVGIHAVREHILEELTHDLDDDTAPLVPMLGELWSQGAEVAQRLLLFGDEDNTIADEEQLLVNFNEWRKADVDERTKEMTNFVWKVMNAPKLAMNLILLPGAVSKAFMNYQMEYYLSGVGRIVVDGRDSRVRLWRMKGILSALFLIREHFIAYEMQGE